MGCRGNIVFRQQDGFLGLYLHNGGYKIRTETAKALIAVVDAGRERDAGYATRIAVSQVIGASWNQEYNYGLYVGSTLDQAVADNEYDVIVVDWVAQQVTIRGKYMVTEIKETYSITGFIDVHWEDVINAQLVERYNAAVSKCNEVFPDSYEILPYGYKVTTEEITHMEAHYANVLEPHAARVKNGQVNA